MLFDAEESASSSPQFLLFLAQNCGWLFILFLPLMLKTNAYFRGGRWLIVFIFFSRAHGGFLSQSAEARVGLRAKENVSSRAWVTDLLHFEVSIKQKKCSARGSFLNKLASLNWGRLPSRASFPRRSRDVLTPTSSSSSPSSSALNHHRPSTGTVLPTSAEYTPSS